MVSPQANPLHRARVRSSAADFSNMPNRVALLRLVVVVAFLFAACGGRDSDPGGGFRTGLEDDSGSVAAEPATLNTPPDQVLVIELEPVLPKVGEASNITLYLSSPETVQTATLQIISPDGNRELSQELGTSAEGRWTYSWTPSTYGLYSISAVSKGSHQTRAFEGFFVAPPGYEVTQTTAVVLTDLNGDGWAEELRVKVEIVVPDSGDYVLSASIANDSGVPVASAASTETYYGAGTHELELAFDGSSIRDATSSGPLQLVSAELHLSIVGGYQPVAFAAVVDNDLAVEVTGLQPSSPFIDFDSFADRGVDSDGDGILEGIAFTGEFQAPVDGHYQVQANLSDSRGRDISIESWVSTVAAGVHQFEVFFGARDILYSGEEGPFYVTFVAVTLDTSGPSAYEWDSYATANYSRDDFSATRSGKSEATLGTSTSFLSGTSGHITFIPIQLRSNSEINVELDTQAEDGSLTLRDPSGGTIFVARPSKGNHFYRDIPILDRGEHVFVFESRSVSSEKVSITARAATKPIKVHIETDEPRTAETVSPGQVLIIEFDADENNRYQLVLQSSAVLSGSMYLTHPSAEGRSMDFEDGKPRPVLFDFPAAGLARIVVVPDKAESGVIEFEIVRESRE